MADLTPEQRKGYAGQLANNPLLTALLEEAKQAAVIRWAATTADQQAEREDAYAEYRATQRLENMINNISKGEISSE